MRNGDLYRIEGILKNGGTREDCLHHFRNKYTAAEMAPFLDHLIPPVDAPEPEPIPDPILDPDPRQNPAAAPKATVKKKATVRKKATVKQSQ